MIDPEQMEESDERSLIRNVLIVLCGTATALFAMGFVAGYLVRGF